ncbi:MAG: ABC transporter ATP-binding protein, partial [Deltaproteobacteria bacterium]|nr:ABC transporter ATP-binding protein [Deltaproteobacteria bacterium]
MIEIRDLSIDLGAFHLRHVDLAVQDGEYVALLGPTGAGKTVLLECIVGLHRRHAGAIAVDGIDVTRHFPEERNVGYVPQDYALFPNLTVRQNLAYGLKARRAPAAEIADKVNAMLARLGLGALAQRFPVHLSGGEQQRVALGRALITGPRIVLLDEPLSALDENLRCELAGELRQIQRALQGTFLHVCHNLEEALEVA